MYLLYVKLVHRQVHTGTTMLVPSRLSKPSCSSVISARVHVGTTAQ